jgi:type II secretory pathway component PulC
MRRVTCACLLVLGLSAGVTGRTLGRPDAGASGQPAPRPPQSALPLELVGVMVDSAAPARSACLIRCTFPVPRRSASMLEVGAKACDIAEITEIGQDAVVIRNIQLNALETLRLQAAGRPPQVQVANDPQFPAPRIEQPSPDQVNIELPKASVDTYLLNLPELLKSAQATPHYIDGVNGQRAIEGFEIAQIRAGSVVEQIGLRNGDVILEVNGETLDSLPTVLRLFGQVQAATQATLTVLRGSQRMTFVFNTK